MPYSIQVVAEITALLIRCVKKYNLELWTLDMCWQQNDEIHPKLLQLYTKEQYYSQQDHIQPPLERICNSNENLAQIA